MAGRIFSSTDYDYGFQGQLEDDEIKGEGNSVNYKYRMHDPRIGRFFAVDPLTRDYPHNSPYAFSENSTIAFVELEGLEKFFAANGDYLGSIDGSQKIRIVSESNVKYATTVLNNQKTLSGEFPFLNNTASQSLSKAVGDNGYIHGAGAEQMGKIYY